MMTFVMTATPLAMTACGHVFADAAFIIQWHILGMYLPSFFTGHLISRFGVLRIILAGTVLMIGCVLVNLSGVALRSEEHTSELQSLMRISYAVFCLKKKKIKKKKISKVQHTIKIKTTRKDEQ